MSYDRFGRTPEQARRDRRDAWGVLLVGLLFAALLGVCVWGAIA